ncbi:MAG: hypothetical protein Q9217_005823 [Psora testacea]
MDALTPVLEAKTEDEDKPRVPPPAATPLEFPDCRPCAKQPPVSDCSQNLVKLFSNILRTGPSLKHLEALNVDLVSNVLLEDLLPGHYLPPLAWLEDPAKLQDANSSPTTTPPAETLSNGGPLPCHEAFFTRVRELLHDNEDAFRTVQHRPARPDHPAARVLHFRKFWDNLALMAEYWDTSLDMYSKSTGEAGTLTTELDEVRPGEQSPTNRDKEQNVKATEEETYTGRRRDTGRNMPGKYREDTVFAFVEPLAWCFRCRLEHARMQPKLKMHGMILPLPHNGNIYRTPRDTRLARRGILEGPMVGVFCRDQVTFRRPDDAVGEGKQEILDLLREVGLMLMLAQKRAREGQEEQKPGKDQWWATKPRWGGGPGGDLGVAADEEGMDETPTPEGPRKRSKKMNKAELWRTIRPPVPTWEAGITYKRVGCVAGSDYDDVTHSLFAHQRPIYLLSSVNHHISIIHLRIHAQYTDELLKPRNRGSNINVAQEPWYKLEMKRSKWFDLLGAEDRMQAMRGIWAVLGWLMRNVEESDTPDQAMR